MTSPTFKNFKLLFLQSTLDIYFFGLRDNSIVHRDRLRGSSQNAQVSDFRGNHFFKVIGVNNNLKFYFL